MEVPLPSSSYYINDNKAQNVEKEGKKIEVEWKIRKEDRKTDVKCNQNIHTDAHVEECLNKEWQALDKGNVLQK